MAQLVRADELYREDELDAATEITDALEAAKATIELRLKRSYCHWTADEALAIESLIGGLDDLIADAGKLREKIEEGE